MNTIDRYTFTMKLNIPRTYSNTESQGYRKYQTQTISGDLFVEFGESGDQPIITVSNLVNKTHKINGKCIEYEGDVYETRWNVIGSNKTGIFQTPSVVLKLDALPDYAIEAGDDNSLILTLGASGSTKLWHGQRIVSRISGGVAGQLGCGCAAYGHTSPTRVIDPDGASEKVDDIAAVWGTFTAVHKERSE